jgi:hypothetical protein
MHWSALVNDAPENLIPLTILLGSGTALLGVVKSAPSLILVGIALPAAAASAAFVSERRVRCSGPMPPKIERFNLDSLHLANLGRRLNGA